MKKPITRTVKRKSPEVRKKISESMKAYWDNVILLDEEGNVIEKKHRK